MASSFGSCIIIIIVIIATVNIPAGASNQYKIGDTEGWRLPDEKNTELYKIRASKITFLVGDSIAPPVFLLDKSGFYYFVSSDFDHCRKGQRLMIEVKGQQLPSSMAGARSPSPLPSTAVLSWIIPSFRTPVALEAFMIMNCCPFYGPCLA